MRHPLIGGGSNDAFFAVTCSFKTRSWRHRGLRGSAHPIRLRAGNIGEMHGSRARALPNSASKSDTPVARRSTLRHRVRHFRRGGLGISIV